MLVRDSTTALISLFLNIPHDLLLTDRQFSLKKTSVVSEPLDAVAKGTLRIQRVCLEGAH